EWYEKGKDEVPGATVSEKNYKYGVNIRGKLTKPVPLLPKQKLQIVPVNASIPEKMGQPIKLKVYFDGKPAAGARILHDWVNDPDDKGVKTAKDGTVTIKVRNQGLNVIVAVFNTAPDNPAKTNTVEHLASLSFVLPHEPECARVSFRWQPPLGDRGEERRTERQHVVVEVIAGRVQRRGAFGRGLAQPDIGAGHLLEHESEVLRGERGRLGERRFTQQF